MGSCYSSMATGKTRRRDDETVGVDAATVFLDNQTATNTVAAATSSASASPPKWHHRSWKKKSSFTDADETSLLQHIPGRMSANASSKTACLYTQQGKKGINQDAMLVWENFAETSDTVFCGVFDGHGPFGHMVAKKVRDSLPLILSTQWKTTSASASSNCEQAILPSTTSVNSDETASLSLDDSNDDSSASREVDQNKKLPDTCLPLKSSILEAFKLMDKELNLHPTIDCFCSGTTAVTLVKQGQDLVIGNLGDSRAVLATRDEDNNLLAIQLTVDLKPDLPREAARIQQCKGRVFALQDEPEVARLWLPNSDSPGLAMARAFGDFCLKDFGLISIPDVYYHCLAERDEFVVLASDGVWDVLSNKEAVDIVASAPGHAMAARALVDCAVRAWRLKYPASKNDDCAVVCLFLGDPCAGNGAADKWNTKKISKESAETIAKTKENVGESEIHNYSHAFVVKNSIATPGSEEILPDCEMTGEKILMKSEGQSKRSLAECISTSDDEEWLALEGITRVNSLLSLPRFLSGEKRTASWRKWL